MNNMSKKQEIIGLIDADLLDNGTRHPNLVFMGHRTKRILRIERKEYQTY